MEITNWETLGWKYFFLSSCRLHGVCECHVCGQP